jgi:DNA/RNA endonuclease YhcR with UshA esterase domain
MGKLYPNQEFTALIWGSERAKFGEPEKTLQGQRIRVAGTIQLYRGTAEVILNDPYQLIQQPMEHRRQDGMARTDLARSL